MTVIAYSSKFRTMAADSRCTMDGQYHLTGCTKIVRLRSGALVGLAGDADVREFLKMLERATPAKLPTRKQIESLRGDVRSIVVFKTGAVFYLGCERLHDDWHAEVLEITDPVVAIGSGAPYAYGAMDAGASPDAAVRSACKRDVLCALPVHVEVL